MSLREGEYDQLTRTYRLEVSQDTPASPKQKINLPQTIPLRTALFTPTGQVQSSTLAGNEAEEHLLILTQQKQEFVFTDVAQAPILSTNRGFSAPIKLDDGLNDANRCVLAASDTDPFNQWESLQTLSRQIMLSDEPKTSKSIDAMTTSWMDAVSLAISKVEDDPAFAALLLRIPQVGELITELEEADPTALHERRCTMKTKLASHMQPRLEALTELAGSDEFDASAEAAGKRALKIAAIDLLAYLGDSQTDRIYDVFETCSTMTESLASLQALSICSSEAFDDALAVFEGQWSSAPLIMDKWYSVQAISQGDDLKSRLEHLQKRDDFDLRNPNRVRALVAAFAMSNPVKFHDPEGWGYAFVADIIKKIDALNPALSARLATSFENWKRFTPDRQAAARKQLQNLEASKLSRNASDIVGRALGVD